MTTPAEFYMSALAIGFTSRRAKYLLGWDTAKGKSQAEYNAALNQLSDVLKEERKAVHRCRIVEECDLSEFGLVEATGDAS